MILKNPTNETVEINYKGEAYAIPANGTLSVSEEVGTFWRERIHQFLEVAESEVLTLSNEDTTDATNAPVETKKQKEARLKAEAKAAKEAEEAAKKEEEAAKEAEEAAKKEEDEEEVTK